MAGLRAGITHEKCEILRMGRRSARYDASSCQFARSDFESACARSRPFPAENIAPSAIHLYTEFVGENVGVKRAYTFPGAAHRLRTLAVTDLLNASPSPPRGVCL